jgi:hypothetical protein
MTKQEQQHSDVATLEAATLASVPGEVSDAVRLRIRRVCELTALSERARRRALAGETFDIGEVVKLEAITNAAREDLRGLLPKPLPHIVVEYASPPVDVQVQKLEAEVARLERLLRDRPSLAAAALSAPVLEARAAAEPEILAPSAEEVEAKRRARMAANGRLAEERDSFAVNGSISQRYAGLGGGIGEPRGLRWQEGDLPSRF